MCIDYDFIDNLRTNLNMMMSVRFHILKSFKLKFWFDPI